MSKRILLVGFSGVPEPRVKGAQLPQEVAAWSSVEIPQQRPKGYARVERVYFDSCLGDRVGCQLRRLYGHKVLGVRSVKELETKMRIEFPALAQAVGDCLTPAVGFTVTDPVAEKQLGRRHIPVGTSGMSFRRF